MEIYKNELLENLLGMDLVKMKMPHKLDRELYKNALSYLMFLKKGKEQEK